MFDVLHKPSGKVFTVYEVQGVMFLIYGAVEENDIVCWRCIDMDDCVPIGGETGCTMKEM